MAGKITDEQWKAGRDRYETESGVGYGKIAEALDCSRNLVVRKAKEQGWQKRLDVVPTANKHAVDGNPKFTESAGERGTQSANVYTEPASNAEPARVVADAFVAPSAPARERAYADDLQAPDGLDDGEREAFIRAAILTRQRSINARHLKELQAVRATVYAVINRKSERSGAKGEKGAALLALQKGELESELDRVRLALGEFAGKPKTPMPCRITVVMKDGRSVDYGSDAHSAMRLGSGRSADVVDVDAQEVK